MTRLLLVRHGLTEFNIMRRFAGYTNIEMSAAGYAQVEKLRDRLINEKIDAIYSSDWKRAMATAELISVGHNVDIVACPELREANYGDAEGLTFDEIKQLYPGVAGAITHFSLKLKFPGGESFNEFVERVSTFLDRLNKHAPSETILIVSHNGPLRVLIWRLLGIGQKHWWQIRIDNASLSIVETYPRGAIVNVLNDTSHLR